MRFKIAHIVNPVKPDPTSDLCIAQPVTFKTLEAAKQFSGNAKIEQLSICYPEDNEIVPHFLRRLENFNRSILDLRVFKKKAKLPILADIIKSAHVNSDADYLIYSNIDIALLPYFYDTVAAIIRRGYDAFAINRRTITDKLNKVDEIALMSAQIGESHYGHDCFVFKKELADNFNLGNVCIGINWVGRVFIWNLIAYAKSFKEFKNLHLTFHIGNERRWKDPLYEDYVQHNKTEAMKVLQLLDKRTGLKNKLVNEHPHLLTGVN